MPDVEIGPVPEGSTALRGYLARPPGSGPWPGVVVVHEAFGLNGVVRRQAERLASAGFLSVAPDLYSQGGAARCLAGTFRALLAGHGRAVADIDATRGFLRAQPDCTGGVGIIGFCMGGGFALVMANRGFGAAAANYGPLPPHLEQVLAGACPVLGNYGGSDRILPGAAARLRRALDRAGVEHDVKEYPGAGHSFLNDAPIGPRPVPQLMRVLNIGPQPEAAADAWQRIERFFAEHLGPVT